MKFTRIVADLKETNIQLKRIADGIEDYLRVAYGYHMTPPKADTSGAPPEVMYSSDEESAIQELEDRYHRLPDDEEPPSTPPQ